MDWATLSAAIKALFAALAGIPAIWRDEPRPFTATTANKGGYVLLNVIGVKGLGVDEQRNAMLDVNGDETEDMGAADTLRPDLCGQRLLTLSVQPETLDQRLGSGGSAMMFAERLRTRLHWPSALATLAAAGLALVRVSDARQLDYVHDGRNYSRASVDVVLAAASNESDAAIGFIETALLTSEITDEAGTVLPSPPNVVDLEVEVGP